MKLTDEQIVEAIKAGCWSSLEEDCADVIFEAVQQSIGEQLDMSPDEWLYDDEVEEKADEIYYKYEEFFGKFYTWARGKRLEMVHKEADEWIEDQIKVGI